MERRTFKYEGERNEHMLLYEQVLSDVFERRESKCRAVSTKHCRKVKGEQVIILQKVQQPKIKNTNDAPGELFCCQCKVQFFLETDS